MYVIRTEILMYDNLKFEFKNEHNWNIIRHFSSLLIFYIFSFFMRNGCSIQAARLIFLKFGNQQVTLCTNWWRTMQGKQRSLDFDAVIEGELSTEQENNKMQMPLRTISLETKNKMGMAEWKHRDKETVLHHVKNLASTQELPFLPGMVQSKLQWRKGHWVHNKETLDNSKNVFLKVWK